MRYLLCYAVGGVYLDAKSTATRPLDDVIRADDVYAISQWKELRDLPARQSSHPELRHVAGCEYVNWFIVSAQGHPFLRAVIDSVLANIAAYRPFSDWIGRRGVLRLTRPVAYTLAIHPIRAGHPHRYVRFESDLGFAFSIYGDPFRHRARLGPHYSQEIRPVVLGTPLARTATELWYGRVSPFAARIRNRLHRIGR